MAKTAQNMLYEGHNKAQNGTKNTHKEANNAEGNMVLNAGTENGI